MSKLFKQAFTLIELLVVIAIIGILSGLIVVSMSGMTEKANIAKSQVFSNSLKNALLMNMVGQWTFDDIDSTDYNSSTKVLNNDTGNVPDSWSTNEGTAAGGPVLSSNCVSGTCLSFDGVDDYVEIPQQPSLTPVDAMTLEAWMYFNRLSYSVYQESISKGTHLGYRFNVAANTKFVYFLVNTVGGYDAIGTPDLQEGKWYHLVGTYNSTNNKLSVFVNGVEYSKTHIYGGKLNIALDSLWIGRRSDAGFFKGLIDNVRIYNAATSISQVKESYYAGLDSLLASGQINRKEYKERIDSAANKENNFGSNF